MPRLYLGLLGLPSQPELVSQARLESWYQQDWLLIAPLFGIAALFSALELPSLGNRRHGSRAFLAWFLAPVVLGETLMSVHRYWAWRFEGGVALRPAVIVLDRPLAVHGRSSCTPALVGRCHGTA